MKKIAFFGASRATRQRHFKPEEEWLWGREWVQSLVPYGTSRCILAFTHTRMLSKWITPLLRAALLKFTLSFLLLFVFFCFPVCLLICFQSKDFYEQILNLSRKRIEVTLYRLFCAKVNLQRNTKGARNCFATSEIFSFLGYEVISSVVFFVKSNETNLIQS